MKKLIGIVVLGLLFSGNAYSEDNYFIKTAKEFNREFIKAKTAHEAIYHMQKLNQMLEEASIIADNSARLFVFFPFKTYDFSILLSGI